MSLLPEISKEVEDEKCYTNFYSNPTESVLTRGIVVWNSRPTGQDRKDVQRIGRQKIIETELTSMK